ncbi:MAG: NAD(P)/FAD-dependent oxidoreductase [Parachlamydiales bacterium]|nr:NAD(P)/FAD-dependent oxidoreductase [Parachlamydiales bacterium]
MGKQLIHVVIGGGAAGIFAAIRCKTQNPSAQVIVLEKTNQVLAKVRISGGGRCNVTHACFDPVKLTQNYPRGSKELIGPFHRFQPKDTVAWFEERGVALKTESDGRMFPTTDSSETIIQCLIHEVSHAGVEIRKQQRVESIEKKEGQFLIQLENQQISADSILLATGSSSWGHSIAKKFGHAIVEPVPSLFTFNVPSSPLLDLSGISVPDVIVSLKDTSFKQQGPLLLTHWGFSGPAILKLSAWAARKLHQLDYKATLQINWLSIPNQETLYQNLLQKKQENPQQTIPTLLPSNLLARLCKSLDIDSTLSLGKIQNKALAQLAAKLYSDPYFIEGKTTYKQEFVTAGGVDLKSIDFRTMESKIVPGLFFAGEILNIDGITGGFNFQNAWTTGWLAGTAIGNRICKMGM